MATVQPTNSNVVPAILAEAREWLDTPYHHQGRLKDVGVDCIGLIIGVAYNVGLIGRSDIAWIKKAFPSYSRQPEGTYLRDGLSKFMPEVLVSQREPGDVILVSMDNAPRHVVLYTERDTIIHAYAERGKCVETRYAHYWRRMSLAAFRMSEIDPLWDD
jgi:NlpC/P60 family putative phage cell wall peptidase